MSKRIMNEMMCLAEQHDIIICYQDTDSAQVINRPEHGLHELETAYL